MGCVYAQEFSGAVNQYDALSHPTAGVLPKSGQPGFAPVPATSGRGLHYAIRFRALAAGELRGHGTALGDLLSSGELVADRHHGRTGTERARGSAVKNAQGGIRLSRNSSLLGRLRYWGDSVS